MANDLRWMNSGPLTGLSEIGLALQPGSSIAWKSKSVIPVAMASADVGNDVTITVAAQSGNFQLNDASGDSIQSS